MPGRVLPKTQGANAARNVLADFVQKHAPDRPWGARGQIIADPQNPGKLALQISGDPGYFPVGLWAWLRHAGLDPLTVTPSVSPLSTDVGGDILHLHTHALTLPAALSPPQAGDEVFVIWMDKDAQQPLVLGKIEWSH